MMSFPSFNLACYIYVLMTKQFYLYVATCNTIALHRMFGMSGTYANLRMRALYSEVCVPTHYSRILLARVKVTKTHKHMNMWENEHGDMILAFGIPSIFHFYVTFPRQI